MRIHREVTPLINLTLNLISCPGTRLLQDNLSDLRAQIAANQKGIQLVSELIDQYGLDVVQVVHRAFEQLRNYSKFPTKTYFRYFISFFNFLRICKSYGKILLYEQDQMHQKKKGAPSALLTLICLGLHEPHPAQRRSRREGHAETHWAQS